MPIPKIQSTTDYDAFKFIIANRDQSRGHVENLKKGFEERGNLTQVQPILVNENMEVIDGQHRLVAAREMKVPVYYTVYPGLRIGDARSLNILHRSWTTDDYARSYALAGDTNYQRYLNVLEDFGFNHSITLTALNNNDKGAFKLFREGEFTMTQAQETAGRAKLEALQRVSEYVPFTSQIYFAKAYMGILDIPGFDERHMLRKLGTHESRIHRMGSVDDYKRMLEEIYNHGVAQANRLRLF
jgi:hypothetical protein